VATAGADCEIKIWRLLEPHAAVEGLSSTSTTSSTSISSSVADPSVEYMFTLIGHTKSVNCVRWSPNGECLASASDGE
jgi:WD40 repeat protein